MTPSRELVADRNIRLLAFAGTGQNGSTLLSRLLGELPGFVAVGEIGRLWDKALVEGTPCSCGLSIDACPFWGRVGEVAFGGWGRVDGAEIAQLRDSLALADRRLQHPFALPFLLAPSVWPSFGAQLRRYQSFMRPLYEAVSEVAEGRVIVDAMKIPAHVYMLRSLGTGVDVRYVHLVRDSRGVANSKAKVVPRQGSRPHQPHRGRRGPCRSAEQWAWFNLAAGALARVPDVAMIRVRYEDVVRSPLSQLERISMHAGSSLPGRDLAFIGDRSATLAPGHLIAGNRMRMTSGHVELAEDTAWRRALPKDARRAVTALTWPLLWYYGYM